MGLPDYRVYDVLVSTPSPNASMARGIRTNGSTSSSDLYAGAGSGIFEFTGAGLGIIAGTVTDARTGLGITGATLSTSTGGIALAWNGNYVMQPPAGICLVSANVEGYMGASTRNVNVRAGEEATVDFTLTPMPNTFSIKRFKTDPRGPIAVGTQATFTAEAESAGGTTLYYRFWVASNYGTPNYGNWQMIQDYSTNNTCTWKPKEEGNYVVVAWITDDTTSGKLHQAGIAVSTTQASTNPVQIAELESDISYPLSTGTQITLASDATGGNGTIEYQFWVTDGTNWRSIQEYSSDKTCTWTPSEAGCYIIVVWASDTGSTQSPPIAGWTCTVD
jgi:hypothetical protein